MKSSLRCIVVAWDTHHNCIGRAWVLYQAAKQLYQHVELIGFGFNHLSHDVWQPLRHVSLTSLPEPKNTEALIAQCEQTASAIDADVVIACKARLPSLLLGYCIKQRTGAQLIVDIDDQETAFVGGDPEYKKISGLNSIELLQQITGRLTEPPYSAFWTFYAQACIANAADSIITCNTALQELYGGKVIPHLRDLSAFENPPHPAPVELAEIKEPVVMFLGTPHRHKGVVEIAKACQKLGNVRPVFIGQIKDRGITNDITRSCGKAVLIGDVEFGAVPACLAKADVTVMLQDNSPATKYQLPAKACDALAAGVQIITSNTEPMRMLARMGFLGIQFVGPSGELHTAIESAIRHPLSRADKEHNAALARQKLSYESGAKTMAKLSGFKRGTSHLLQALLGFPLSKEKVLKKRIILLLWKQNDFGVFGRRCDMVAKYLTSRKDVAHVLVVEKPLSALDMQKYEEHKNPHFKLLHQQILRKRAGVFNSRKMTVCSPVMGAGLSLDQQQQFIVNYCQEQVQKILTQHPGAEIDAWIYPYYRNSLEILDSLPVKNVVADVVDDHRQWPGLSEEQKAMFHEHYQKLLARADYSLYNCNKTMVSIGSLSRKRRYLVPNGMDTSLVYSKDEEVQELRESLLTPGNWTYIIGYAGNLESKIDWPLVLHLADKNKDALLLMIGSTHMAKELPRRRNIKYTGPIAYEKLKTYLQTFDVAIIPHLTTSLTEAMNPLKAYVYGTLGIPIVSTHCPNIPDLPQIRVAAKHGGFTKRVRTALEEDHNLSAEEIYAITMQHSWSSRLKSVVDRIHR